MARKRKMLAIERPGEGRESEPSFGMIAGVSVAPKGAEVEREELF
jgi:hypothetical protein